MASPTEEVKSASFGTLIAFVAPGAVAIWGIAQISDTVSMWFGASAQSEASGGGFLFVLLASLAMGVFISGVRHQVMVAVFGWFGLRRAQALDESRLRDPDSRAALAQAVEDFFRYHQFYGNMTLAVLVAYIAWLYSVRAWPWDRWGISVGVLISVLLLASSAFQSLKRFYEVEGRLLRRQANQPPPTSA
jgi:ABC-type multidrug transport system fused ATPase/permease subunit